MIDDESNNWRKENEMKDRFIRLALLTLLGTALASGAHAQKPTDILIHDMLLSRRTVRVGDIVRVSLQLRNQGPLVARSYGPSPRTVYAQNQTYRDKGYAPREGRYSIVMTYSGPKGHEWIWLWGLGGDMKLGEIRRVSYPIRFTRPGTYSIYVGSAYGDAVQRYPSEALAGIRVVARGQPLRRRRGLRPATPPARITVNGKEIAADQRPVYYQSQFTLSNVQIMVPIRFVTEALGAQVDWDRQTRTAHIRRGERDLQLRAGRREHLLNGKTVRSHTPLRIRNGRTMVPLRFVTQSLGGTAHYDPFTRTVALTLPAL